MGDLDVTTVMVLINLAATIGGLLKLWVSFEKRMTVMETHLLYILPKRKTDECEGK